MDLHALLSNDEPVVATSAAVLRRKQVGQASMSFATDEIAWLYQVVYSTVTRDRFRLVELAADPIAIKVTRKVQTMKLKAATVRQGARSVSTGNSGTVGT